MRYLWLNYADVSEIGNFEALESRELEKTNVWYHDYILTSVICQNVVTIPFFRRKSILNYILNFFIKLNF